MIGSAANRLDDLSLIRFDHSVKWLCGLGFRPFRGEVPLGLGVRCDLSAGWLKLNGGDRIWQEFKADASYLSGIAIPITNYRSSPIGILLFRLYTKKSGSTLWGKRAKWEFLSTRDIQIGSLFDEERYEVHFDAIEDSQDRLYAVEMVFKNGDSTAPCGVLLEQNDKGGCFRPIELNEEEAPSIKLSLNLQYSPPVSEKIAPPGLMISPVSSCDLNCVYCISRETRKQIARISPDMMGKLEELASEGVLTNAMNDFSGDIFFSEERVGGYLDFMIGLDIPFAIHTHGNRLPNDCIEKLIDSKLHLIGFSMDACNPDTYSRIRRGAKPLPVLKSNIKRFMRRREELGRDSLRVLISMVLMKSNIEEMFGIIEFAKEVGIKEISGNHLQCFTEDVKDESLYFHQDYFNEMWYKIMAKAEQEGVSVGMPIRFEKKPERLGHRHCGLPWSSGILLANGDLMACCVPTTVMGNIKRKSIEEIWNGPEYQELRRRVNSDDPPEVCKHCPVYRIESNPYSYLFYKIRPKLKPLWQDMRDSIALRESSKVSHSDSTKG